MEMAAPLQRVDAGCLSVHDAGGQWAFESRACEAWNPDDPSSLPGGGGRTDVWHPQVGDLFCLCTIPVTLLSSEWIPQALFCGAAETRPLETGSAQNYLPAGSSHCNAIIARRGL